MRISVPTDSGFHPEANFAYKRKFRLYDVPLGEIAKVIRLKYPDLHAIDVGANVGDTAALIRQSGEIPVLCIEGDPTLIPILTENVKTFGAVITIEPSFVGQDGQGINLSLANDFGRNASLVHAKSDQSMTRMRSLEVIVKDYPGFASSKLLKVDTEGFDFDILQQSGEFLSKSKPVVFFEYDPDFRPHEPEAGLRTIEALIDVGYTEFHYYDNFGNFLVQVSSSQQAIMKDLNRYLASNRKHSTVIYYFDVCAFHAEDADIALSCRNLVQ